MKCNNKTKIVNHNGRLVQFGICPPPMEMIMVAYSWRLSHGGLEPVSNEDHLRNIEAYCRNIVPMGAYSLN